MNGGGKWGSHLGLDWWGMQVMKWNSLAVFVCVILFFPFSLLNDTYDTYKGWQKRKGRTHQRKMRHHGIALASFTTATQPLLLTLLLHTKIYIHYLLPAYLFNHPPQCHPCYTFHLPLILLYLFATYIEASLFIFIYSVMFCSASLSFSLTR